MLEKRDFGSIRNKSGKYDDDAVLENPHSTFLIPILNVSLIFFFGVIDASKNYVPFSVIHTPKVFPKYRIQ